MTNDSGDAPAPGPSEAEAGHAAVTSFGRALPRVLVLGALVLLTALGYLLDARTHLRPLAAVTFASAAVVVIVLTELGLSYLRHLGAGGRTRARGRDTAS